MTGNQVKTLVQRRVRDSTTNILWDLLFNMAVDRIFTKRIFKFSRTTLNYIHPQSTFEKTFDGDPTELSLVKIINCTMTTSFSMVGGVPTPASNSAIDLDFVPYHDFVREYPDQLTDGTPSVFTEIRGSDGSTGMQIGIYERPNADAAVWIYGDFIPFIGINDDPIPILPNQFHDLIFEGVLAQAAEEAGKERLCAKAEYRFARRLNELIEWDSRQPSHHPVLHRYGGARRSGPFFPGNFDRSVSR